MIYIHSFRKKCKSCKDWHHLEAEWPKTTNVTQESCTNENTPKSLPFPLPPILHTQMKRRMMSLTCFLKFCGANTTRGKFQVKPWLSQVCEGAKLFLLTALLGFSTLISILSTVLIACPSLPCPPSHLSKSPWDNSKFQPIKAPKASFWDIPYHLESNATHISCPFTEK